MTDRELFNKLRQKSIQECKELTEVTRRFSINTQLDKINEALRNTGWEYRQVSSIEWAPTEVDNWDD